MILVNPVVRLWFWNSEERRVFLYFNYSQINSDPKCYFLVGSCCILAFDPAKNAIPRWCTGRRWHILMAVMRGNRVGGNWLMKWDEVKKFPWYTHRLTHRKRVTCELHDSYFRLMTIKHSISKIEWVIEWVIEWTLNYYITQKSRQLSSSSSWSRGVVGKDTPGREGPPEPRWSLGTREVADKMQ